MGRLTLNILLSFAQFERELAGERIRDKFAASRRKGIFMGGHPPLGYDVRDRKLVVNPAEAELVRLIFRRFLDLGSALLLIRELNAQGYRTKSWTTQVGTFREGRAFDKGTLYKILRNRTYLGEAVHKGKSYPGEHEPIVDRATWERVHEVLATNARRRGNEARARTPAPLRGPDQPATDLGVVDDQLALAGHVVGVVRLDELFELEARVTRIGRHGQADALDIVAAARAAHRRLHPVAPERPKRVPFLRDVLEAEAGLLERFAPDVDMVGSEPHRQRIEGAPAGGRVEQGGGGACVRVEQALERQDLVREVNEPALVGPLTVGIVRIGAP